ncbi:hypothetical protein [Aureimonas pseudogalii]|uniref:Tetraacyldisaccharide-1-P 4'-kinase n=1 Tax=Aureimonas pseudogalii TaxID=1744844 RepID=A0A7W6EHL4_9HYPH|nr:hypothetical protein [Aureimonas pseudogalii]MBB3998339.1 tetraacyldisaccharide-1-P 4'-kinase [Aureimonas pseudogalii]
MSIAPASLLTWLLRALAAMALLAFVVSTGPFAGHADAASFVEASETTIEAVGDEIADLASSPLTADDPAPLDLLPSEAALVGPSPSRARHLVTDDVLASFDASHLDRPPRPLSADPGRGTRRGA